MVYVFYPSNILGGAELLMIRTANLLQENNIPSGVIDYEDGWVINNIDNPNIVKRILARNRKISLNDDDIVITTSNFLYQLDYFFEKSKAKILLWTVQPYNVVLDIPKALNNIPLISTLLSKYLKRLESVHRNILEDIIKKSGIVAMDGACDDILFKKYNIRYSDFLPIYINNSNFNTISSEMIVNKINMVWLGRLDLDFKIHILMKVLSDIERINDIFAQDFVFDIIGDGPGLNVLKYYVAEKISFKVNFVGTKSNKELNDTLEEYHIGFAMGTSALELSSKKIPTILLDFSYNEIQDYKYRWLFESENYNLGRDISFLSINEINEMHTLDKVFTDLSTQLRKLSEKCYSYTLKNHSSTRTISKLMNNLSDTKLTFEDIYNYSIKKPYWQKLGRIKFLLRKNNL